MERDDFLWNADETKFHFNSHAHVERDPNNYTDKIDLNISTHTLTWSVTLFETREILLSINFNSHAHVERDR